MADISMCNGKKCKVKHKCYRYLAEADKFYQSYAEFDKEPVKEEKDCKNFWKAPAYLIREVKDENTRK